MIYQYLSDEHHDSSDEQVCLKAGLMIKRLYHRTVIIPQQVPQKPLFLLVVWRCHDCCHLQFRHLTFESACHGPIWLDVVRCWTEAPGQAGMHGVRPGGFHYETSVLRFWQCIWCCFQVFRHFVCFWKEATRYLLFCRSLFRHFDRFQLREWNASWHGSRQKTDWRDIFREKSPLNVAILCIFWDVGWEWFHDTEDWKDWNWNQDPGCPKIKKMTWRFCFSKKSLGVLDVLLQNTKGGSNPLSELEEICGIGTLEHPCHSQSGELLYCGCCSCLGTFWTRSWHGRSPVCHDCVDHVLNHFWPYFANSRVIVFPILHWR